MTVKKFAGIFCAIFLLLIISFPTANAASIKIDGTINNVEWKNSTFFPLTDAGDISNCDVTYADLRAFVDQKNPAVFLCFNVLLKNWTAASAPPCLQITINGQEKITVNTKDTPDTAKYDKSTFSLDVKTVIQQPNYGGFSTEMRIGLKTGLPQKITLGIQFIDGSGEFSNCYNKLIFESEAASAITTTQKHGTNTTVKNTVPTTRHTDNLTSKTTSKYTNAAGYDYEESQQTIPTADIVNNITENGQEQSEQNTEVQAVQSPSGSVKEVNETSSSPESRNRSKQIAAISFAVLLIIAAVCICVFAGIPKNNSKAKPVNNEKPANENDDDF